MYFIYPEIMRNQPWIHSRNSTGSAWERGAHQGLKEKSEPTFGQPNILSFVQLFKKKKNCPLGESESGDLVTIYFQEDYFPGLTQSQAFSF